ncbi:hypothetical protein C9374_002588 [Naegleria lovaniensis]|uniref:Uncharacterized protein n=1 Tax=Naegleria lovaniensis TaxID=51637 RepID=A0AA88KQ77_NAELO|nr:uncharacterized protein C9374_002588 [Naegleria lovaniensis]KAG2386142.1 hypothetical protein C9374_002588 [Naegleria lovaniensis]
MMRGNNMRLIAKRASALISTSSATGRASSTRMFSSTSSVMKLYGSSEMTLFSTVSSSSSSRNSSSRNITIRNMANGAALGQLLTVFGSNDDDDG